MSERRTARFAAPDEAREKYDAIIPAYQAAFAAEPWYEVSKCGGCSSGYSRQYMSSLRQRDWRRSIYRTGIGREI